MKFSIIIPIYNVERYVEQCVRSVLQQTYDNFEIILVDDGSTDSSGLLCDVILTKDSRVQVIHQLNAGAISARNRGIDHASGDYILFLDGDAYWLSPTMLERFSTILEKHNTDVIEFDAVKFIDGQKPIVREDSHRGRPSPETCRNLSNNKDVLFCHLIKHNAMVGSPCNKVINMRLFSDNSLRFREGVTSEDIEWTAKLLISASTWLCFNEYCYAYRQRSGSTSHSVSFNSALIHISNLENIRSLCKNSTPYISSYLGIAVANMLLSITTLNYRDLRKLSPSLTPLLRYLSFAPTGRARLINASVRIFGFIPTMVLLKTSARAISHLRKRQSHTKISFYRHVADHHDKLSH